MSADAAQKAILYFVELLMNSDGPLTISQLAGHFGDRTFTPQMRTAAGSNETGLKKLLQKFPSLFTIRGNHVSIYGSLDDDNCADSEGQSIPDVSAEMSAVHYFRSKLMVKGNQWIEIKSLAGHLSQASPEIRNVVGPQVEFGKWLSRHTHIFEVSNTNVRLQKDVLADSLMLRDDSDTDSVCSSLSFSGDSDAERKRSESARATKQEQKLVWLVKDLIKAKGIVDLNCMTSLLMAHAPIELLGIGERVDTIKTIRKYPGIFTIAENNMVSLVTGAEHSSCSSRKSGHRRKKDDRVALMACSGTVFHLSKLWGIVDLGQHEHVFFDVSILDQPTTDLRSEYQIGDTLYFDAVRAPRTSRAKWKAVRIWRDTDDDGVDPDIQSNGEVNVNDFIARENSQFKNGQNCRPNDLCPSNAGSSIASQVGVIDDGGEAFLQPVDSTAEQTLLNNNWRNVDFLQSPVSDEDDAKGAFLARAAAKKFVDAECQTVSTGDIIATQFFFSD